VKRSIVKYPSNTQGGGERDGSEYIVIALLVRNVLRAVPPTDRHHRHCNNIWDVCSFSSNEKEIKRDKKER